MKTHADGTRPGSGEVFVFGSNLAGRHGAGAAKMAVLLGAKYGIGKGLCGMTYALPTKDRRVETLDLAAIRAYVEEFCAVAESMPDVEFFLTAVGCGLAGYTPAQIAPMFRVLPNVSYPDCFEEFLR